MDIDKIVNLYRSVKSEQKMVVMTEKDAMRLTPELISQFGDVPVYYLPIQVEFVAGQSQFDGIVERFCEIMS